MSKHDASRRRTAAILYLAGAVASISCGDVKPGDQTLPAMADQTPAAARSSATTAAAGASATAPVRPRMPVTTGSGGAGTSAQTAAMSGAAAGVGGSTTPAPKMTPEDAPNRNPAPVAGSGADTPSSGAADDQIPCATQRIIKSQCQTCHGATPIGGAPMPLVSFADWHAAAKTQPKLKVYELAAMRLNDAMRPMPPTGQMPTADKAALDQWLSGGALAGTSAEDASCKAPASTPTTELETSTGPLVPEPGETCYEFPVHASTTDVDDPTPYDVGDGEHYEHFFYDIPWPAGTVATRFGSKLDNVKVLHHWLLFRTNETDKKAGEHETAPLPTLSGADALLLSGWALGGKTMVAPQDVGFELPDPGAKLNVQWHFYNSTGQQQLDHSSVQVCTVPAAMRANRATFSWLGTENLGGNKWLGGSGMPAHKMSTYSGTCKPRRAGMNDTDPINIIVFWPHMHQLGTSMNAVINRKDGTKDMVFDQHFDFASQEHYNVDQKLWPGESITVNCNFNNTTDRGVPFGESSDTEMCYMFTYAWPANTLENGASSLIGAKNTCW